MRAMRALVAVFALAAACKSSDKAGPTAAPEPAPALSPDVKLLPVRYAAKAAVREKVKTECFPERYLQAEIAAASGAKVVDAIEPTGKVLSVEIFAADAPGGGIYSGTKQMLVRGSLTVDGEEVGSFQARRTTMGGPAAPFVGTCDMLQRISRTLGRDIAHWLAAPTKDARLGEL